MKSKLIIGITGGIASGKSALSSYLSKKSSAVVDADIVSREVMCDVNVVREIAKCFPGSVVDGKTDRNELKKQAFSSAEKTKLLNEITHAAILSKCAERLSAADDGIVLFIVPLMFETGADRLCDVVVTVSCPSEIRLSRLMKRDGIDFALAKKIMDSQMSDDEREKRADYVIVNNSSEEELWRRADELLNKFGAQ